jgi:hypothetical protein
MGKAAAAARPPTSSSSSKADARLKRLRSPPHADVNWQIEQIG